MQFNEVTGEHILKAIQRFKEKGFPEGFGQSSTYDLIFEEESYPPKAIMAYASNIATGEEIINDFPGGENTECFKALKQNGFKTQKKKSNMNEKLYHLKQEFLNFWPSDKLEMMTLEQYTDTKRENSFCYWLEHITRDLGSIVGGSSYKFGIYKMSVDSKTEPASNRTNDGVYAWHTKYGNTAEEAFQTIKQLIIRIANYAKRNDLNPIEKIDLGDAYKWKIAFLYNDFNVVNLFKSEALRFIANSMYSNGTIPVKYGDLNQYILSHMNGEDYFDFTEKLWMHYNKYNSKEKEFKEWLENNGEIGSNKPSSYLRAIKILINELKIPVYTEDNITVLEELYDDLLINQRDPKGKYAYNKKSYGEKGFYSAAIKTYIEFLNHRPITELKEETDKYEINFKLKQTKSVNQIFYGPPGTGKTYTLKRDLFPLYTTKETSISLDQHFESVVKECSWWEVIAIALLQLGKSKVNDIFNHKWVQKKAEISNSNTVKPTLWGQLQSHTIEECNYVNVKSKQQPLIFNKTEDSSWEILKDKVDNEVPELYELINKVENFNPSPDKEIKRYKFVTFHQSFSYEDFIEGIKPVMSDNTELSEDLGYKIEDGIFKEICKDAALDPNNRYAIFIDEINRGNVSAIFGELITLIEKDKRKGAINEMSIELPYSKKKFSVPSNLDIYGTMNTADRSVEALDTALRRRFEFKEMMPNVKVIEGLEVEEVSLSEVLETINKRIELLVDRDHTIGHSYFVNVDTKEKLAHAFNDKIVPLLQEYFYGDYGKIGLVLGKGFVETIKNDKITFADFGYENSEDFKIPSYNLKIIDSENIIDALHQLLNKPVEEN
ncbi:McrB family protein [Gaetbulibacter jejuensis]|uniref:McrB family protein n=1 Tax=Gaetbulibacter jejuensis TaxID=584607 RepID=UPI00300ADE09